MADITNIEDIIAREGRFTARPQDRWPITTVASIDFDILFNALSVTIFNALLNYEPFVRQYTGTRNEIQQAIDTEVDHLCHQALNELWNRLRTVAETYDRQTRNNIFQRRAPTMEGFVLPRFIASMLSSIGPLRITDTFRDTYVIYAPEAATAANFGRANPQPVDMLAVNHIQRAFRDINLPTASIQSRGSVGSFFTTAFASLIDNNSYDIVGYFHPSHYTRNDAVMAMMFGDPNDEENPFQDLSYTLGFVSDEDLIAAFRALAPPTEGVNADDPPVPVGANFAINRFGLAPANNIPVRGRGDGIYVLGRGYERVFTSTLARNLTQVEIDQVLTQRILTGGPAGPAPANIEGANPPPPPN